MPVQISNLECEGGDMYCSNRSSSLSISASFPLDAVFLFVKNPSTQNSGRPPKQQYRCLV
jgi:hypothetical protein